MSRALEIADKATVLIVDDTPANLTLLTGLLADSYRVKVANSGERGLAIARSEAPPDLILLDIMMPELDGYEVCRRLKGHSETQDIPIIFITAITDVENESMGFALGAVDYISKPFNKSVVLARVGVHMKLKRQSRMLESMVFIDALTEIPNRRAYDRAIEKEWARCLRLGSPITLAMIDVDFFKNYNDHYGHGAGDECLVRLAKALHTSLERPGDFVGRYGGEEFVAILPNLDLQDALRMANVMHANVEALQIAHVQSAIGTVVTISIGMATVVPAAGSSLGALTQAADKMLYDAKNDGRGTTKAVRI